MKQQKNVMIYLHLTGSFVLLYGGRLQLYFITDVIRSVKRRLPARKPQEDSHSCHQPSGDTLHFHHYLLPKKYYVKNERNSAGSEDTLAQITSLSD